MLSFHIHICMCWEQEIFCNSRSVKSNSTSLATFARAMLMLFTEPTHVPARAERNEVKVVTRYILLVYISLRKELTERTSGSQPPRQTAFALYDVRDPGICRCVNGTSDNFPDLMISLLKRSQARATVWTPFITSTCRTNYHTDVMAALTGAPVRACA